MDMQLQSPQHTLTVEEPKAMTDHGQKNWAAPFEKLSAICAVR